MENIVSLHQRHSDQGQPRSKSNKTKAQTIAITSGKGGVGKTNITTNLAIALAQRGSKVCIFDADTSLANINIVMGLNPIYTIEHLLNGTKKLNEIMLTGPAGVAIIPAASGIASCNELNPSQQQRLIQSLEELENRFDYLLIDTAAGIGSNVTRFIHAANSVILVISTEPTSLTDAFALLRILKRGHYNQNIHVLVNMAVNYSNSIEVFKRFAGATNKYLQLKVFYLGYITDDIAVQQAVRNQCPVILYRPDSLASRCYINLVKGLKQNLSAKYRAHRFSTFWKLLLAPDKDDISANKVIAHLQQTEHVSDNNIKTLTEQLRNILQNPQTKSTDLMPLFALLAEYLQNEVKPENTRRDDNLSGFLQNLAAWNQSRIDIESEQQKKSILNAYYKMSQRIHQHEISLSQQLDLLEKSLRAKYSSEKH